MTLQAAFRAEVFKLRRNRVSTWWAFWLVPAVLFLFGLALEGLMPVGAPQIRAMIQAQPVGQAARSFASADNPLIQLFYVIGAAGLFAGEYRWETWRLIAPRNGRVNLVMAKFAAFLMFAAVSLALIGLGGFAASFYGPLVHGAPLVWPESPGALIAQLGLSFLAGFLQLAQAGALAAFGAVLTRSMLGGVVPTLIVGFVQMAATSYYAVPTSLEPKLLLPQFAAAATRTWSQTLASDPEKALLGAAGAACLTGWTLLLVLLTAQLFRSQDLARE